MNATCNFRVHMCTWTALHDFSYLQLPPATKLLWQFFNQRKAG